MPDPTTLTMAALAREIGALREILTGQITGQREAFEARLTGMDRAVDLLQAWRDGQPGVVDARIDHLSKLLNERFNTVGQQFKGIDTQFDERDVRVREAALSQTTAVNAALQAQKEAAGEQAKSFSLSIDKSEKGTLEQINQQRVLLEKTNDALDSKISDLKDRINRIEATAAGRGAATTDGRAWVAAGIGAVLFLVALVDFAARLAGK